MPGAPRSTLLYTISFVLALFAGIATASDEFPPERWESVIAEFEAADLAAPPPEGAVVFVGSSSIRLWHSLADDFTAIETINRGFGGSGMGDLLYYADRIVTPYQPDHVVVYTGENDLARNATAETVYTNYRDLVSAIHAELPEARITFVAMKPSPSRVHLLDEKRRGNALIKDFSETDERLGYIDVFEPMLDADGVPRAELFVDDMLHLNDDGYRLWREIIGPYVEGKRGAQ
jgi:lysophospholipase L1-like esterase